MKKESPKNKTRDKLSYHYLNNFLCQITLDLKDKHELVLLDTMSMQDHPLLFCQA